MKKERRGTRGVASRSKATHVLPLLTDLIFVSITILLVLNYVRVMLLYAETSLVIIREAFFVVFLLAALILLVIRRRARVFSGKKVDYLYTVVGFSSALLFQLTLNNGPFIVGASFEVVGLVLVVGAFLSLNRSFGLAPENRGVKTGGMYRFVRHPMYLGYILAEVGYVLDNFSPFNLLIWMISVLFLLLRLRAEERLLMQDRAYRSYANKTRWRLIPPIF